MDSRQTKLFSSGCACLVWGCGCVSVKAKAEKSVWPTTENPQLRINMGGISRSVAMIYS